jgi:hypothetical protein
MLQIASPPAAEKPRVANPHALQDLPRHRACKAILEAARLGHEICALAAPLLLRARKRRNRADTLALEALLSAIHDQLAEIDGAGTALRQLDVLWSDDAGCRR